MDDNAEEVDLPAEPFSDPRRRSPRLPRRVTLTATSGKKSATLESVVVNEHGGLVEGPLCFAAGSSLTLRNQHGKEADALVIWSGPAGKPDLFDMGIELMAPDAEFWGLRKKAG